MIWMQTASMFGSSGQCSTKSQRGVWHSGTSSGTPAACTRGGITRVDQRPAWSHWLSSNTTSEDWAYISLCLFTCVCDLWIATKGQQQEEILKFFFSNNKITRFFSKYLLTKPVTTVLWSEYHREPPIFTKGPKIKIPHVPTDVLN